MDNANNAVAEQNIPGYTFGEPESAHSPLAEVELRELEQTVGWSAADAEVLAQHAGVFREQAEEMVDSWRAVIASQPHLAHWFNGPYEKPDDEYKARVKRRFVQWVVDTATRPHDSAWLDYQEEIGLRHTPQKKNSADARHTPPLVPLRYVLGFLPAVADIRKFLEGRVADKQTLHALERAWTKAVLLEVVLWTRPYTRDGLW
jgi:hypothetical protein